MLTVSYGRLQTDATPRGTTVAAGVDPRRHAVSDELASEEIRVP